MTTNQQIFSILAQSGRQRHAAGLLKLFWRTTSLLQKNSDDMMQAAKVIAYDAATNVVQVQPIIEIVTTANQLVQRAADLPPLPVLQLSGGGGFIAVRFPVNSGDLRAGSRPMTA